MRGRCMIRRSSCSPNIFSLCCKSFFARVMVVAIGKDRVAVQLVTAAIQQYNPVRTATSSLYGIMKTVQLSMSCRHRILHIQSLLPASIAHYLSDYYTIPDFYETVSRFSSVSLICRYGCGVPCPDASGRR